MEQKIATHQLTQVKTMIRKNYNTKYSIYDIIAFDFLIFIETFKAEQSAFLLFYKPFMITIKLPLFTKLLIVIQSNMHNIY